MSIGDMNKSSLTSLRDQLLEKRALQTQARATSERSVASLKTYVQDLNDNHMETLLNNGIDISRLHGIDYDRLTKDAEYLRRIKDTFAELETEIVKRLEELLNVQN